MTYRKTRMLNDLVDSPFELDETVRVELRSVVVDTSTDARGRRSTVVTSLCGDPSIVPT